MAQRVVHFFEAVQVDEQHRNAPQVALRIGDTALQVLGKHQAIGQVGQRVVVGQVVQPGFSTQALFHFALQALVGMGQLGGAFIDPGVKLLVGFQQPGLLRYQQMLGPAHHQHLPQVQEKHHPCTGSDDFQQDAIQVFHKRRDVLVQLHNSDDAAIGDHGHIARNQVHIGAHTFKAVKLVAVGQFAGGIALQCRNKPFVVAFAFPDLGGRRRKHGRPIEVVDLHFENIGVFQQGGDFGSQAQALYLCPQLICRVVWRVFDER